MAKKKPAAKVTIEGEEGAYFLKKTQGQEVKFRGKISKWLLTPPEASLFSTAADAQVALDRIQKRAGVKPSPGRPTGAKTIERRDVEVLKEPCPRCGSTDFAPCKGSPVFRRYVFRSKVDGVYYTHKKIQRTRCNKCGLHLRVHTYESRPTDEAEPTAHVVTFANSKP